MTWGDFKTILLLLFLASPWLMVGVDIPLLRISSAVLQGG
jgi:hypothetical protein